jgi:hypothetical protein
MGVLPHLPLDYCATFPASEDVTAITSYSSSSPLFFGRRVIDVQSPKRRPPTTALSKKLHSLPSSVRRIIQPRGWPVLASQLVATAEEDRLRFRRNWHTSFVGSPLIAEAIAIFVEYTPIRNSRLPLC